MDIPEPRALPPQTGVGSRPVEPGMADPEAFLRYLQTLRKYKNVIFLVFVITVGTAVTLVNLQTPIYQARSTLWIQQRDLTGQGKEGATAISQLLALSNTENLDTQIQIILSRSVLDEAFRRANLRDGGRSVKVTVEPIKGTSLVQIRVEHPDPKTAARVANAIGEVYIQRSVQKGLYGIQLARKFVERQIEKVQRDLDAVKEEIVGFKRRRQTSDPDAETSARLEQVISLQNDRMQLESQYRANLVEINNLKRRLKQSSGLVTTKRWVKNPQIDRLEQELIDLEIQREAMLKDYPPQSPYLEQIDAKITSTKARLQSLLSSRSTTEDYIREPNPDRKTLLSQIKDLELQNRVLLSQMNSLSHQIQQEREALSRVPAQQSVLAELMKRGNLLETTYTDLLQRLTDLRMSEAAYIPYARIVDRALPSSRPVRPKKIPTVALSALLGIFLGLSAALLLAAMDMGLRSPEEVEQWLGLPTLAMVPFVADPNKRMALRASSRSLLSEGYRMLRSNLKFSSTDRPLKVFVITSAVPREGKTHTAANLALTMAQNGLRTALVDADLRHPNLHRIFNINREPGLTNLLVGDLPLEEAWKASQTSNLWILPSGPIPPNPAEILDSEKMYRLLNLLRGQMDVVVLDTPPCSILTDASILGRVADGVLMVVSAGNTDRRIVTQSIDNLAKAGCRILGVVLNKVDLRRESYYHYYYHYYYYYGYYGYYGYGYGSENGGRRRRGFRFLRRRRAEEKLPASPGEEEE